MHWWEWTNERTNKWTRLSMFFSIGSRSLSICSTVAVFVFGPFWYWFVLNSISWNTIEQTVCSLSLSSISLFSSFPCESVIFCGKPLLTFNWEPKHLQFFSFFAVCPPLSEGVSCKKELFQVYFHGYLWISLHLSWFLCECCEKSVLNVSRA